MNHEEHEDHEGEGRRKAFMIDYLRLRIILCTGAILFIGCNSEHQSDTTWQNGGLYNTNREIESFFEPKIADGTIHIGMQQNEFEAICGSPASRERRAESEMIREVWRYGNLGARSYRYGYRIYVFTFENGRLASWRG